MAYQSENGRVTIQFRTGPCLRIGQAVAFFVRDGAAVEITILAVKKEAVMEPISRTGSVAAMGSKPGALRHSKRLQREIGWFHNATVEEQLKWIDQAEVELHRLLEDDGLEGVAGDRLCRLVRRVAAWLHRPVAHAAAQDSGPVEAKDDSGQKGSQLQKRIRGVLITAL